MIHTLIIEDEKSAADRIEKLLLCIDQDINILDKIQSISSSVNWLNHHSHPDLIILDIQLADGLSFEIFKKVKVESFVIFTTAFDEYAIRAFELNSIDYLLKSIGSDKLEQSLKKFKKLMPVKQDIDIEAMIEVIKGQRKIYKKRFLISIAETVISIDAKDIAYFYSSDKITFLCTFKNRHYLVDFSPDTLENAVNPERYFRINRRYLVSMDSLDKILILSKSRIKVILDPPVEETIYVSNARTHVFRQWLDD